MGHCVFQKASHNMGYDPDKHKVQFIIEKSLSCDILEKLCLTTEDIQQERIIN